MKQAVERARVDLSQSRGYNLNRRHAKKFPMSSVVFEVPAAPSGWTAPEAGPSTISGESKFRSSRPQNTDVRAHQHMNRTFLQRRSHALSSLSALRTLRTRGGRSTTELSIKTNKNTRRDRRSLGRKQPMPLVKMTSVLATRRSLLSFWRGMPKNGRYVTV